MYEQYYIDKEKEIKLDDMKPILSRTDLKGNIRYCNTYFQEISGYSEKELLGAEHNIIRHPDMPKIIFKLMWERLKKQQNILAVVKNKSKDGRYYWVTTLFEIKYHPIHKTAEGYLAIRKAAPHNAVEMITPLYKKLLEIEDARGIKESELYLREFLEKEKKTYDQYMEEIVNHEGVVMKFLHGMKKMFIY
ncbi:PAS domain S-box protein [Sulfurimonas microaerophilic]|uniref:PAS domain S-box protein n=1 Tax=Sulfurimonas microaerophilic TaxID=3058392 RepID=UPI0027151053|nr:PAS domain S-box protein [Sulfurimonas sp. hsl 1-7]